MLGNLKYEMIPDYWTEKILVPPFEIDCSWFFSGSIIPENISRYPSREINCPCLSAKKAVISEGIMRGRFEPSAKHMTNLSELQGLLKALSAAKGWCLLLAITSLEGRHRPNGLDPSLAVDSLDFHTVPEGDARYPEQFRGLALVARGTCEDFPQFLLVDGLVVEGVFFSGGWAFVQEACRPWCERWFPAGGGVDGLLVEGGESSRQVEKECSKMPFSSRTMPGQPWPRGKSQGIVTAAGDLLAAFKRSLR